MFAVPPPRVDVDSVATVNERVEVMLCVGWLVRVEVKVMGWRREERGKSTFPTLAAARTRFGLSRISCVIVPAAMKGLRSCGRRGVLMSVTVYYSQLF